jgi:hypothetical protein
MPRNVLQILRTRNDLPSNATTLSAGIAGNRFMWPTPANHDKTEANEKPYGSGKSIQRHMDGKRCYGKELRKMLRIPARRKSTIFGNGFRSSMKTRRKMEGLQTFNVSHHTALAKRPTPWEKVDTVFPEPQERNRYRQKSEEWSLLPFLESVKFPVPMTELVKVKPFSDVIKGTLFPEVDGSDNLPEEEDKSDENEPVVHWKTQTWGKQPAKRAPEESPESDEEEEDESPEPPTRRPVRKTGAVTQHFVHRG